MGKKILQYWIYLAVCTFTLQAAVFLFQPNKAHAAVKPNVILITVDNVGVGDICFKDDPSKPYSLTNSKLCGDLTLGTPTLDGLATQGVTLTNFYTPVPICSPSRAALMTGQDPRRYQVHSALPDEHSYFVSTDAKTLAEILQIADYNTAIVGKWHLGWGEYDFSTNPATYIDGKDSWRQGFEYNYVLPLGIGQGHKGFCLAMKHPRQSVADWYYKHSILNFGAEQYDMLNGDLKGRIDACNYNLNLPDNKQNPKPASSEPFSSFAGAKSLTQILTERAIGYIDNIDFDTKKVLRDASKPFFLYLAYPAPHAPLYVHLKQTTLYKPSNLITTTCADPSRNCTPKEIHDACYNTCKNSTNADTVNCTRNCELDTIYPYVIREIDDNIKLVLNELELKNLSSNTIVIFTSDNGPYMGEANEYWTLRSGSSGGLRGGQKFNYEGGVRVPFIVRGPNYLEDKPVYLKNKKLDQPSDMMDILPTLAKEAGGTLTVEANGSITYTFANNGFNKNITTNGKLDGNDISSILRGNVSSQGKDIQSYWYYADVYDKFCVDWVDTSTLKTWLTGGYCKSNSKTGNNHPVAVRSTDTSNFKLLFNDDGCIIERDSTCIPKPITPGKLFNLSTTEGTKEDPTANLCIDVDPSTGTSTNICTTYCIDTNSRTCASNTPSTWQYKSTVEALWQKADIYSQDVTR